MQRKSPEPISSLIQQWLDETSIVSHQLLELKALDYLRSLFKDSGVDKHIHSLSIQEYRLTIKVSSGSLRNHLQLHQVSLIEQINEHLQYNLIDHIQIL